MPLYLIPTGLDPARLKPPASDERLLALRGATMGTGWSLRFAATDTAPIHEIEAALEQVFSRVITQMSNWERGSFLCAFNDAPRGWVEAPADFLIVLKAALEIAQLTGGAFNPGLHDAVVRAGFGPAADILKTGADASAHNLWRETSGDDAAMKAFQPGGLRLDFSSIAKGYAVDLCASALRALGLRSFLMEIGGEFVGEGIQPNGQPWRVDLQLAEEADSVVTVALAGVAVATSGDFVRSRVVEGRRLSHLLNGRTSGQLDGDLSAVSVVADSCMAADAWATGLFALGCERGLELANAQKLAAIFMRRNSGGRLQLSDAALAMAE